MLVIFQPLLDPSRGLETGSSAIRHFSTLKVRIPQLFLTINVAATKKSTPRLLITPSEVQAWVSNAKSIATVLSSLTSSQVSFRTYAFSWIRKYVEQISYRKALFAEFLVGIYFGYTFPCHFCYGGNSS